MFIFVVSLSKYQQHSGCLSRNRCILESPPENTERAFLMRLREWVAEGRLLLLDHEVELLLELGE